MLELIQGEGGVNLASRDYIRQLRQFCTRNGLIFIVDEVQRVPELLSAIHRLTEEDQKLQFILTGSSARRIKRSGINLLAGRAVLRSLHPFLLSEVDGRIDFNSALNYGMLPLITMAIEPIDTIQSYISLYIREEVQYEGFTRNIGAFSRFLEAISFSNASLLNISNVARECEVERKVVENYVSILEDIMLGYRLNVFAKRAKRALISHPKFYLFDTGVFRALRPKGPLDNPHQIDGAALEGLVFQHLKAWNDYSNNHFELFFWRSKGGVEVDFILYGEEGIYAFEVKNASKLRSNEFKALQEFKKDYPMSHSVLLYRGSEKLKINNVLCVPCQIFLQKLRPDLSLAETLQM